ncbi:MAG: hypothetical protein A3F89_03905 [Deltaproteobacteria bacterium RIFCSPLOWO2_12_FULL_50_11]|nr:MAG: hypothetical protein A3F89_03905 [Deltaproteobacteria bacterium RIFCSPLOWO2_12_FULL_50_11]
MKYTKVISIVAVALGALFFVAALSAPSYAGAPDNVDIKVLGKGAKFSHAAHNADGRIKDCSQCHVSAAGGGALKPEFKTEKGMKNKFHSICLECHKTKGKGACTVCHK